MAFRSLVFTSVLPPSRVWRLCLLLFVGFDRLGERRKKEVVEEEEEVAETICLKKIV